MQNESKGHRRSCQGLYFAALSKRHTKLRYGGFDRISSCSPKMWSPLGIALEFVRAKAIFC